MAGRPKMRREFRGVQHARCTREVMESIFQEAWNKQNREVGGVTLLDRILDPGHGTGIGARPKAYASDRDQEVAASVIQWLGSDVGESFLFDIGFRPIKSIG